MNTARPLSFAAMAVHLGEEVERRRKAMRMSKTDLAKAIGVDRSHVYDMIDNPTMDTGKLRLCGRALGFNFFKLLANDMDLELGDVSVLEEPAAVYARRKPEHRAPLRVVIEVDPDDTEAQKAAMRMAEELKGPAPGRDKEQS